MSDVDQLIVRWWPMVRGIARDYPLPGMAVEDVEQEGLIALLEAARRFDPERGVPFASFANTVVRLRLNGIAVKANRHKHDPLNNAASSATRYGKREPLLALLADPSPEPDRVAIARELLRILILAVRDDLTEAERVAIQGVLNEHTYREIANDLNAGGALRYVDNAVQRARRKLRAAIA